MPELLSQNIFAVMIVPGTSNIMHYGKLLTCTILKRRWVAVAWTGILIGMFRYNGMEKVIMTTKNVPWKIEGIFHINISNRDINMSYRLEVYRPVVNTH